MFDTIRRLATGVRPAKRPIRVNHRLAGIAGWLIALLLFSIGGVPSVRAADPPQQVKSPLSPEESLKAFRLAADLKIEIVAAEPEVVSPVSIAFDEEGRLWVVEMSDYPNGPAPDEPPKSRIKLLEDRDADGRFETAHIFADKLLFATGVQPWRGGVIVTLAGEIAYFKDTDEDHKADVRETWYRGFVQENPQLRANHPRFALDNHIYVANGLRGGTIVADKEKWGREIPPVSISGKDFRFDPLTGDCEAVSGNGQFGLTFDDFGNRFICSNRNPCRHVVLEDRYLKRNPFLAVSDVCQDVSPPAEKSRIYPISRAWTTSNLHAGQFTAACGLLIYRGDALPTNEYYGNSFVCEPTGNLVHRDILERDGPTFKSHYAQEGVEFLASPDAWFRPVDLTNGPDGALYVADMYRAVIEHPEWVPGELKNRPDLYDGSDRGRIYRIVARDKRISPTRRGRLKLAAIAFVELEKFIEHPNPWQRETAARLLFERQDRSLASELERIAHDRNARAATRVQAIRTLAGLANLADAPLRALMVDPDHHVRDQAIAVSEARLRESARLSEALQSPLSGWSFQAVLSLGELKMKTDEKPADGYIVALLKMALALLKNPGDEWTRKAAFSSLATERQLIDFFDILSVCMSEAEKPPADHECQGILRELFELVGAQRERLGPEILCLLPEAVRAKGLKANDETALGLAAVDGLGRGLARSGRSFYEARLLLVDLAVHPEWKKEAQNAKQYLDTLFVDAVRLASDDQTAYDLRIEAISVLRLTHFDVAGPILMKLAESDASQEIRALAVDTVSTFSAPQVAAALLKHFGVHTPPVRRRILQAILRDAGRTKTLISEIEAKRIAVSELDPPSVQALMNHKDETLRNLARTLLAAAIPADRKQVLEKYQPALALKADPQRGRAIFEKNCVTCHKIGDLGVNVAPDISDSRTKTPAQLLTDILNPNQAIDNNYVSYMVLTKDGKTETGIVATETATSITLRQPEGKTVLVLRQEIDELKSNGVSLMPEGLEKNITIEQMADLIAFIKNWRYLDGSVPLGK